MTSVELVRSEFVAPEPTLDELAATINREHEAVVGALESALVHAIRAGEALMLAQRACPSGSWLRWIHENFGGRQAVANGYMRLAENKDAIYARFGPEATQKEALLYLRGLPRNGAWATSRRLPEGLREEVLRLHAEGMANVTIARLLDLYPSTVARWINPDLARRDYENRKRKAAERRAAQEALRQKEREQAIKRAVRKAGVATQEAWTMAERMQDVLAQAQRETEDREARRALSKAGEHHRKMRDEIVRALGVS